MTRIEGALLREHDSISMLEGVIDESAGFIIRQVSAMGLLRSSSFWDSDHFHCSSSHGSLVELAEIASSGEPEAPPLWALPIPVVDVGALASWMTRGVCSPLSSQVSVSNWHWLPRPNSISIGVGGANCARVGLNCEAACGEVDHGNILDSYTNPLRLHRRQRDAGKIADPDDGSAAAGHTLDGPGRPKWTIVCHRRPLTHH